VSKSWFNDSKVGCKSPFNSVDLIEKDLVGVNFTLICSLFINKHYRLCTHLHLIHIQFVVLNHSHTHLIIVTISLFPKFWIILDNKNL
jgi:hypothetical protein